MAKIKLKIMNESDLLYPFDKEMCLPQRKLALAACAYRAKNMSLTQIRKMLGLTQDEWDLVVCFPSVRKNLEACHAWFTAKNADLLEEILEDPNTPVNTKAKIARDNLRTQEGWAPYIQKIQIVDKNDNPICETTGSYSEDELDAIRRATEEADAAGTLESANDSDDATDDSNEE